MFAIGCAVCPCLACRVWRWNIGCKYMKKVSICGDLLYKSLYIIDKIHKKPQAVRKLDIKLRQVHRPTVTGFKSVLWQKGTAPLQNCPADGMMKGGKRHAQKGKGVCPTSVRHTLRYGLVRNLFCLGSFFSCSFSFSGFNGICFDSSNFSSIACSFLGAASARGFLLCLGHVLIVVN